MRKQILILCVFMSLLLCFTASGCGRKEYHNEDTLDLLKSMDSCSSDFELSIINDKGSIDYSGKQYYDRRYGCRLELGKDRVYIYKNNNIYVNDLKSSSKYVLDKDFDELFRLGFISEYISLLYTNEDIKYETKTIDGISYEIVKLTIPGTNPSLNRAELYVEVHSGIPDKVLIYDKENKQKVTIKYKNFNAEVKLNEDIFKIQ